MYNYDIKISHKILTQVLQHFLAKLKNSKKTITVKELTFWARVYFRTIGEVIRISLKIKSKTKI